MIVGNYRLHVLSDREEFFMKKADPRLMLIMSMTVFGTLGPFVRNIPVSSGELAPVPRRAGRAADRRILTCQQAGDPLRAHQKEVPLLLLSGAAMASTGSFI